MKRQISLGAVLAGFILVTACASAPDYREASSQRSAGYSESIIETNRYAVSYRLNNDDYGRARELAMRRVAELTLESGFDTFELVTESSGQQTERDRYARTAGPDRVIERDCGLLGCATTVRNAPGDPFGDGFETERSSVTATLEIMMSNKDANVSPSLYDASEVFANLSD